jgi:hypothetical protein
VTRNRHCSPARGCGAAEYQVAAPTLTSDRNCSALIVCNATTEIELVAPTATSDRVCECDEERFRRECNATTALCECVPHHGACSPNAVELVAANLTQDRVCECSTGYWGSGFFCRRWQNCTAEQFQFAEPTNQTDRGCNDTALCNRASEFESQPPSNFSDRVCQELQICQGRYDDGMWVGQYEANRPAAQAGYGATDRSCQPVTICDDQSTERVAATAFSDRVCNCGAGLWFDSGKLGCNSTTQTSCAPGQTHGCKRWSICSVNAAQVVPPGFMSDRLCQCRPGFWGDGGVCNATTVCVAISGRATQYQVTAPTPTSDRNCSNYTTCAAGILELRTATAYRDRVCGCSAADEWMGDGNVCHNLTVCIGLGRIVALYHR